MRLSSAGFHLLKELEGFRAKPYVCAGNRLTAGFGHVLKPDEVVEEVTAEQASLWLLADVKWAEKAVLELVKVGLKQREFDALVLLVFNIGRGAFAASTMLTWLNQGNPEAPSQFPQWIYASGRKNKGLIRRREIEQALFLGKRGPT